jgi:hypothetical protein
MFLVGWLDLCRFVTHSLAGGGTHNRGYDVLDCNLIARGDAGNGLGHYSALCYLPNKVARYLYEFHSADYVGQQLPAISVHASSGTIHKLLKSHHVSYSVSHSLNVVVDGIAFAKCCSYLNKPKYT